MRRVSAVLLVIFLFLQTLPASAIVAVLPLVLEGPLSVWGPSLVDGLVLAVAIKTLFFFLFSPFKPVFSMFAAFCISLASLLCGLLLSALFLDAQTCLLALILLPYFLQKTSQGLVELRIFSGFPPRFLSVILMGFILLGLGISHASNSSIFLNPPWVHELLHLSFALTYISVAFITSIFLEERALTFLQTQKKTSFNPIPLLFRANALILGILLLGSGRAVLYKSLKSFC
jgi:hypothetical protein